MERRNPCVGCTRVVDPSLCENKRCKPWQNWFLSGWRRACRHIDPQSKGAKAPPCAEECL